MGRTACQRVKVPGVLQMEAAECGAAALAMVLGYHGRFVSLEMLRLDCGVSRDGSRAGNLLKAAAKHGLKADGYRLEPAYLHEHPLPMILHWNFNHFVVLEGFDADKYYIQDPAGGRRQVSSQEFNQSFTGIALVFSPGPNFVRAGARPKVGWLLLKRLSGSRDVVIHLMAVSVFLLLAGLVVPTFTRFFVDEILLANRSQWIPALMTAMAVALVVQSVLVWLKTTCLTRWQMKLSADFGGEFFRHVLRLPIEFYQQRYSGEIGARVQITDSVAALLTNQLATAALDILVAFFFIFLMFQYNVTLTWIGIAIVVANLLFLRGVSRLRVDQNRKLLQERGRLTGTSMNGLQLIESIKAGGYENDFFAQWAGAQARVLRSEQSVALYSQLLAIVPAFLFAVNAVLILGLGGWQIMDGRMTVGMFAAYQLLTANFLEPVGRLVGLGGALQEVTGGMERLNDVLNCPAEPFADERQREDSDKTKLDGTLELNSVSFGYSQLESPLLEDFSLKISPGQSVALVGKSGSGKTTVAKLVAGLYQPWAGDILLDGKPRQEWPRQLLASSVAVVSQDICLFAGTVRENLTLWDESIPEVDVVRAAKDAAIHDTIVGMKAGYDSQVDEDGRNFSGGQRQKIEIARSLAINPSLLVLDEATSSLDSISEQTVIDNIRRRGIACLIVAHRLSTVRDCDEIIVMEQGKIVQRGRHDEMKDQKGPYRQLMESEAPGT